jgi:hypothetical protein
MIFNRDAFFLHIVITPFSFVSSASYSTAIPANRKPWGIPGELLDWRGAGV